MGKAILLEKIGIPGIRSLDVYLGNGGYNAVRKGLLEMTPAQVQQEVTRSGLRGRGGAGFPTGLKWSFLDRKTDKPRYLVCNADESEPGTFKDRYLMEKLPHLLIEGLVLSSYALGSGRVIFTSAGNSNIWSASWNMPSVRQNKKGTWERRSWERIFTRYICSPWCRRLYLRRRDRFAGIT